MNIEFYGATDPGKKRSNNEDSYLLKERPGLYAVADGIGGNEGGEVASLTAIDALAEAIPDHPGDRDRTPPSGLFSKADAETSALRYSFILANREIQRKKTTAPELSQMGTTLTALLLSGGRGFIGHIGDSRAYLFRSGRLKQLTHDHSIVAEQVRAGVLTPEQARSSPHRHVITRALGIAEEVNAEFQTIALRREDTILLCTDGLTDMVDDPMIGKILEGSPLNEAAHKLVSAANEQGGTDNITVVLVRIV